MIQNTHVDSNVDSVNMSQLLNLQMYEYLEVRLALWNSAQGTQNGMGRPCSLRSVKKMKAASKQNATAISTAVKSQEHCFTILNVQNSSILF